MEAQGVRMYNCYSLITSAIDGNLWSASRPGLDFHHGKDPRYPLDRRLDTNNNNNKNNNLQRYSPVKWTLLPLQQLSIQVDF